MTMWMFCDDAGNHPAKLLQLKAECFPADNFNREYMGELVGELIENGLIVEYLGCDGASYWHVTGWDHQKIDKPKTKHPPYCENSETSRDHSENSRDHSEKGRRSTVPESTVPEGKGVEECPERSASGPAPAGSGFRFLVKAKGRQKEWELPAEKLTEYLDTFDGLDVRAELRKAKQWTHDNPAKRKTPTGMARFLTSWLSRANDQGRGRFVDEEQRRSEERKRMIAAEASRREAEQQAAKASASPSGIGAGVFRKVDGDEGEDAARRRLMKAIERV
ncbi:MAG: hypothetical protein KDI37_08670 [Xanthomonadales bacterium]|nr:hypothetical protein [Xanthomonadales bacterium]